jgi:hypothetical protein
MSQTRRAAAGESWTVCPTPADEPHARECWFCGIPLAGSGKQRRTKEHVFARWLLRGLNSEKQPFAHSWNAAASHQLLQQRTLVLDAFVSGRVCAACNNGWMSQLEVGAKDNLWGLARGRIVVADLEDNARHELALWATKTAFAAQAVALGPKLIPKAHRRAICNGELGGLQVVGRICKAELGLSVYGTQEWKVPHPPHVRPAVIDAVSRSYKVIVTVGQLVLAVCHWPEPAWPLVVSRNSHFALWPLDRHWLTYGYATDIHGVLTTAHTEIVDMTIGTIVAYPPASPHLTALPARELG